MRRAVACMLVVCVVALSGVTSSPAATSGGAELFTSKLRAARAARQLVRLRADSRLGVPSRRHAAWMARAEVLRHDERLPHEVRGWRALADIVGEGPTVDTVFDAFMESPNHRATMLDGRYRSVGVGVGKTDAGWVYVTVAFARFRN